MFLTCLQLALAYFVPAAPPEPWVGVAGAHGGAVAVWSGSTVVWSGDGVRFAPVLADAPAVSAVALDDDGTAWVARAGRIGIRESGGLERWLTVADEVADIELLRVRRGRAVVLARMRDEERGFFVSRDGGRTRTAERSMSARCHPTAASNCPWTEASIRSATPST
jgi:hypothetical protein